VLFYLVMLVIRFSRGIGGMGLMLFYGDFDMDDSMMYYDVEYCIY
jgi:hypothetical protein